MANLVEVAQRVPTAVAEVTGQKLSGVISNIKDTLNPANFFQAAGSILTQEAPILGTIGSVVGDLTTSLLGGASPEEATEVNTEETSDNTKQVKETSKENLSENKRQTRNLVTNKQILESLNTKLDTLSNEQVKTTEALLGNNNALENVTNNQVENIQNTESLVNQATASEFKDLETQREAQRLQEDSIAVQEENKESGLDLQTIMGGLAAGITGLVSFLQNSFIGKMIKGLTSGLTGLLAPILGRRAAPDIGGAETGRNRGRTGGIGGAIRGAGRAAKFLPGIGLAVTGIMGLFDGVTAGVEEYKKSGKIGEAVKQGFAGTLSGLTFGLISRETISDGFDSISSMFAGGWEEAKKIFTDIGRFIYNPDTNEVLGFKLPTMEGLKEMLPNFEIPELTNPLKALAEAVSAWEPDGMIGGVVKNALLAILPDVGGATGGAETEEREQTGSGGSGVTELTTDSELRQMAKERAANSMFTSEDEAFNELVAERFAAEDRYVNRPEATEGTGNRPEATEESGKKYEVKRLAQIAAEREPGSRRNVVENDDGTFSVRSRQADIKPQPPVQRTAEMMGTQAALADTERMTTGGGNNIVNAPQVNNNVTNNNMGSQQPTPKNQDSTLDRYGSSEMAFIGA